MISQELLVNIFHTLAQIIIAYRNYFICTVHAQDSIKFEPFNRVLSLKQK